MFISKEHMPQVLEPEDYTSQEIFDREMELLFHGKWQFVATMGDLPNDGDYITTELFGQPIIVWRKGDEVYSFLNVCPHRFSTLSKMPSGNCEGHLKCQYHGWEFDETGNTCKIPDAKSFKPMEKGKLGLTQFHTERVAQLIYVNLSATPNDLKEQLGAGYDIVQSHFSDNFKQCVSLEFEVEANWKVRTEITLESYHIDSIHPKTFVKFAPEEKSFHELEATWSAYISNEEAGFKLDRFLDRFIHKLSKIERDEWYRHFLFYPAMTVAKMRLFTMAETIYPLAPNRTRVLTKAFVQTDGSGTLRSRIARKGLARYGEKFIRTVTAEDNSVLPSVQRGLESQRPSSPGLLSVREERVHHFQCYVKEALANEPETVARKTVAAK